ncbi:MAG: YggS family pyridoxal phosphate-dependent enzyme [Bryobacterales bacterium]
MIRERLQQVRDRIARAAERAGRDPSSITLIAVSKIKPAADIVEAYEAGQRDFGENYVQEFQTKKGELPDLPGARFHLIGHLQSNKSRIASELFDVIQTVDSIKLARRLEEQTDKPLDVFLEVKLSEEDAKHGMEPDQIRAVQEYLSGCRNLRLRGLMTMPPWSDDPEAARPYFRRLRELAESHGLAGLSMGMSHDLETAVEEGATIVRVGTAIFGKRIKPE